MEGVLLKYSEEEVIRLFLKNGFQISKKALPLILSQPKEIIFKVEKLKPRPFIITEKHVRKILEERKKPKSKIELFKEYVPLKKPIKIEDYVKNLHSQYTKIKPILSKRMDKEKLISINKISQQKTFSIIGIVREKGENNILLEDPSGEVHVIFDGLMKRALEEICLDDIIGVRCKKIKDKIFAKSIIYPDILSSRKITKTEDEIEIMVVSKPLDLDTQKYKKLLDTISGVENLSSIFLFNDNVNEKLLEDFSKFNSINISQNSNPTLFQIEDLKILTLPRHFFKDLDKTSISIMISIMKRRSLTNTFSPEIYSGEDGFVLDKIPDIVVSNFDENGYKNYKGTTIISSSDPNKLFLVNLKTREVKEITF